MRERNESSHVGEVPDEFWDGTTEVVVVHVSAKTTQIINLNKEVAKNRHVKFPMFLGIEYNDLLISAANTTIFIESSGLTKFPRFQYS